MKEIVILSGKGGTGKTSIAASFAALANRKIMADCDVDAPNLHLVLSPTLKASGEFFGLDKAVVDLSRCNGCGICTRICRAEAIRRLDVALEARDEDGHGKISVTQLDCEGCGLCARVCPRDAIRLVKTIAGRWFVSHGAHGTLVHARLRPGQENSGKLVATVKRLARTEAETTRVDLMIVDGPPGIGCPAMSALAGASATLIVTEPTLSGMHDLERVITLTRQFGIKAYICINKADISPGNSASIESACRDLDIPVLARIPYDARVTEAIVAGAPFATRHLGPAAEEIRKVWAALVHELSDLPTSGAN